MKIKVLWVDGAIREWEILKSDTYSMVEYCVRDGCIDFYGKNVLLPPLPLVQRKEGKDFLIPLNTVRLIEIDKD